MRRHAAEQVEGLIAEFQAAQDDHGLGCRLLELIGEARSGAARPLLTERSRMTTSWARRGLELLDSKESRAGRRD